MLVEWVSEWAWNPHLVNMLGALILLPALAYFLLPQKVFAKKPEAALRLEPV